jgi:arylsulfatase A-like enzyme
MNIILITLDAFNYGLFLNNIGNLPNLSQLKQHGASFENAFSIGPTTVFSFPGIVASVYPYYSGTKISQNIPTIDSMLKAAGYNTAFINESNALLTPFFGYGRNLDFQEHFLSLSHAAVDRELQDTFLEGRAPRTSVRLELMKDLYRKLPGQRVRRLARQLYGLTRLLRLRLRGSTESLRERRILHNAFRDGIAQFIDQDFKEPQFLWIHIMINHLPYLPPEATSKFHEREIDYLNYRGLSGAINVRTSQKLKSLYVETLGKTDQLLGEILDKLKADDLLRDTLIIITSDHGEEFEERYIGHSRDSSSDALLHVPLIFSWPSRFRGKSISTPVSTTDILPTIAELAGLQIPDTARGVSLKNLILNPTDSGGQSPLRHRALYSEAWDVGNLLKPKPGTQSTRRIFTVRRDRYILKVTEEDVVGGIRMELKLRDWINDENLDIQAHSQLVARLRYFLYSHLYEEGLFHQAIISERERIRRRIAGLKKFGGHRNL